MMSGTCGWHMGAAFLDLGGFFLREVFGVRTEPGAVACYWKMGHKKPISYCLTSHVRMFMYQPVWF
jgi:hypothetical protein